LAAFYKDVFYHRLKISEAFLKEHQAVIREKLEFAAAEFNRVHGNLFAINMCLHAASSIILSNPTYLSDTLNLLRHKPGLEKKDPTTVLTVIALYCLIQWDSSRAVSEKATAPTKGEQVRAQDYQAKLDILRHGFDAINWVIGKDAMESLGLD